MSIDISPDVQSRLLASAQAEGVSLDAFLERLINERDELTAIMEQSHARCEPLSQDDIQNKIERGFVQSERGDVVDGDAFCRELLGDLDDMERKRRVG
jgi:hypothetical protein